MRIPSTSPRPLAQTALFQCRRSFVSHSACRPLLHSRHQRQTSATTTTPAKTTRPDCLRLLNSASHRHVEPSQKQQQQQQPPQETYTPPTSGILTHLPRSWVPYAELIRLDKPTGTYYLFFPCLFSTFLAAPLANPAIATPLNLAGYTSLFFTGALIMRGAGCTINDLWDRNLDRHVSRTKFRPLARDALTPRAAVVFLGAQMLAGLGVLLQFPAQCFWYATPSLALVAIYPAMKRVTNYPQVVLGTAFSWGALMGFPTLGVDVLAPGNADAAMTASSLYASCVVWTVIYDMIYAHMDVKDDAKAGIKSIVLEHEQHSKKIMAGLSLVQLALLAGAGVAADAGPIFFVGGCGSAAASLWTMIYRAKLKDARNCWWWFKNGCWITGGGIGLGLVGDYLARRNGWYGRKENLNKNHEEEKETTSLLQTNVTAPPPQS